MKKDNKPTTVWPFEVDTLEHWAYRDNAFTKKECKEIIKIGKQTSFIEGRTRSGVTKHRLSKINWMYPSHETQWIFRRLTDYLVDLNKQFFKFDLFGFIEGLQFTCYKAPDNFYTKHTDLFMNGPVRKLSMSLQLTDPNEYKGGDLRLHLADEPTILAKDQGKLYVFPSYTLHEVTSVTKGTRYSLVAWITGPHFK